MYIAMNRFKIAIGSEDEFTEIWRNRDSRLRELPGFVSFALLRGDTFDDYTLFSSHTVWESQDHFTAWTKSQQFRDAHKNAGNHSVQYLGHPQFEGFTVVLGDA